MTIHKYLGPCPILRDYLCGLYSTLQASGAAGLDATYSSFKGSGVFRRFVRLDLEAEHG